MKKIGSIALSLAIALPALADESLPKASTEKSEQVQNQAHNANEKNEKAAQQQVSWVREKMALTALTWK